MENFETMETVMPDVSADIPNPVETSMVETTVVGTEPVVETGRSSVMPYVIAFGAGFVAKALVDIGVVLYRRHKAKKAAEAEVEVEVEPEETE